MIFVLKNGKFKQTHYTSTQKLIEVFNLDELVESDKMEKQLAKGNHVYCWICPYKTQIENVTYMYWGLDPEIELEQYHQSGEEI